MAHERRENNEEKRATTCIASAIGQTQTPRPHLTHLPDLIPQHLHKLRDSRRMKNLNTGNGRNRIRFQGVSKRIQEVDIDILHRVRPKGYLDSSIGNAPESGARGCFFQDELDRCNELESTRSFKRFYHVIWPLVQSLPEVLHYLSEIVERILQEMNESSVHVLPTYCQLLSVLGKDTGADLFPFFDKIFGVLTGLVEKVCCRSLTLTLTLTTTLTTTLTLTLT